MSEESGPPREPAERSGEPTGRPTGLLELMAALNAELSALEDLYSGAPGPRAADEAG
ncbi:hypothetical protein [Streptomyces naphthomycinicus]|uniref:hypothetical protein n=1 Tax=Streptomyces naphthomycinicus TaxID=2872625 RepID=UPI001CEDCC87|nr:hypothetical protein [Streptomyces sp. TML10]